MAKRRSRQKENLIERLFRQLLDFLYNIIKLLLGFIERNAPILAHVIHIYIAEGAKIGIAITCLYLLKEYIPKSSNLIVVITFGILATIFSTLFLYAIVKQVEKIKS